MRDSEIDALIQRCEYQEAVSMAVCESIDNDRVVRFAHSLPVLDILLDRPELNIIGSRHYTGETAEGRYELTMRAFAPEPAPDDLEIDYFGDQDDED